MKQQIKVYLKAVSDHVADWGKEPELSTGGSNLPARRRGYADASGHADRLVQQVTRCQSAAALACGVQLELLSSELLDKLMAYSTQMDDIPPPPTTAGPTDHVTMIGRMRLSSSWSREALDDIADTEEVSFEGGLRFRIAQSAIGEGKGLWTAVSYDKGEPLLCYDGIHSATHTNAGSVHTFYCRSAGATACTPRTPTTTTARTHTFAPRRTLTSTS